MNTDKPCLVCGNINISKCSCRQSMVRFMELLESARENIVSSSIVTSDDQVFGCIDKLELSLVVPINRADIEAKTEGISRETRLRDKRWYLEIEKGMGIYLYLGHPDNVELSRLITRPSAFKTFGEYQSYLYKYFGRERISSARITRMDLTVDYLLPWESVVKGLDIKNKRKRVQYMEHSGDRTGIQVGSSGEVIVIYDKGAEAKLNQEITRIEMQLKGRKVPIRYFSDLNLLVERVERSKLFGDVILNDISFTELMEMGPSRLQRLDELKALVKHEGFFIARKKLNTSNNFNRDYVPMFKMVLWEKQPQEALCEALVNYFKEE